MDALHRHRHTPVSSFTDTGMKITHPHTHKPHSRKVPSVWCAVGGWPWPVAFGFESEVGWEFVFHLLSAETQRRAVFERREIRWRGREVQKEARDKCWNGDFCDVFVRFEIEKWVEEGKGAWDRDWCGKEMCRDGERQMEGERERNGGWPDGTLLLKFWQFVGGISLGNSLWLVCVCVLSCYMVNQTAA